MSIEQKYYEQARIWDAAPSAAQVGVAEALKKAVPADVSTILDAGCGNGVVTNTLVDQWQVTGCDISATALAQVKTKTVQADLTSLPFEDRSFDLVLSSDVIEHIPDESYDKALSELARVASKYILIAVPFQEQLDHSTVECTACGHRFHAHYHQRSYTLDSLRQRFPTEFDIISVQFAGERWPYVNAKLGTALLEMAGTDYEFGAAICPKCDTPRGSRSMSENSRLFERQLAGLQYLRCEHGIDNWPSPSELLVLLQRRSGATAEAAETNVVMPPDVSFQNEIELDKCERLGNLVNFPTIPYVIPDLPHFEVLCLPMLPAKIICNEYNSDTTSPHIEIFDAVWGNYIDVEGVAEGNTTAFTLPVVRPAIAGYRIRISTKSLIRKITLCRGPELTLVECFDRAFNTVAAIGDLRNALELQRVEYQKRLDALNDLANEIEARRATTEVALAETRRTSAETETALVEARRAAEEAKAALAAASSVQETAEPAPEIPASGESTPGEANDTPAPTTVDKSSPA